MDAATWAFILLFLGLVFLVLEFFIPSSGTLAVMCALSLMAAIGIGFAAGPWTGLSILLTVCVVVPTALVAAVHWWPETPIGRMILIQRPKSSDEVLPQTPAYRTLKDLVGRRGLAKGLMVPSGAVVIDGKLHEAVSEGMPIEAGQPIIVISISTQRLVVRPDNTIRAELAERAAPPYETDAAEAAADSTEALAAALVDEEPAGAAPSDPNEPLIKDIPDPFADEPRPS
jgi:membrane-bound ClpP family serine protease